jgi:hypothetical protein
VFKEINMAYVYESIQNGLFRFTIPGEDKTVTLFKGSKVTVKQKLTGGYLRVLKLVEEVAEEAPAKKETKKTPAKKTTTKKATTKPKAKVEDKITKVEEVVETPTEEVEVKAEDTIAEVKEEKPAEETTEAPAEEKPAPKRRGRRKRS